MASAPPFRDVLRELLQREAQPAHKFGHQVRLYELALQIGAGMHLDDDVIFAAVWLHDIGVFEGNRPSDPIALATWDHVAYAVRRSREVLAATDFPPAKIDAVLRVIEQHQPKDTPASPEATVVRDADILEQLGAVAVFRTAAKLGSDTRFHHFRDARAYLERQLRELPPKLLLPQSRALAAPREATLRRFLEDLDTEAGIGLG